MRYSLRLMIFSLLFLFFGCATTTIISHPSGRNMRVDGNFDDWKNVELSLNEQPPFMIGVSNSADHIYLLIRSNEAAFIRRLRLFGFILWLDDDKTMGLEFPGRRQRAQGTRHEPFGDERQNELSARQQMALSGNDFFLKQVDKKEQIPLSTLSGFSVASSVRDGVSTLEFGFPSSKKAKEGYFINPQDGKITVGLEFKIPPEDNQSRMPRRGRGGMAGGRKGMDRQGAGKQPLREGQHRLSSKTIWFNILLQDK